LLGFTFAVRRDDAGDGRGIGGIER
jgi:hypothetical protein